MSLFAFSAELPFTKLLNSLKTGQFEVTLDPEIMEKARLPIERMIAIT